MDIWFACLIHELILMPCDTVMQDAQSAINDLTGKTFNFFSLQWLVSVLDFSGKDLWCRMFDLCHPLNCR